MDSFKSEHKVLVPVSGKVLPSPKSDATESKFSFRVDWSFNDYDIESSTTVTRYYYGHLNDSGIIEQVIEIPDQLGGSNE